MARKKKHPEHANHERWLVSYADFITLLFAFFVVMFASSQTDKAKAKKISDAVTDALEKGGVAAVVHEVLGGTVDEKGKGNAQMKGPGGSQPRTDPNPEPLPEEVQLLPSLKYLTLALQQEIKDGKIEVKQEDRGLVVKLYQAAVFPSGDDHIDGKMFAALDKIGGELKHIPNPVRLEGHTDSTPIHTARFQSNWELSAARGVSMLNLLHDRCEIPMTRLAIIGYADTLPAASNDTEEGRAKNRRVDIVILKQSAKTGMGSEPAAASGGAHATPAAAPAAPAAPAAAPPKAPAKH